VLFRSGFKTASQAQWSANIRGGLSHALQGSFARMFGGLTSNARNALPLNLIRGFETTSRISLNISYLQVYFYREKKR
jgi:hypothetical protein